VDGNVILQLGSNTRGEFNKEEVNK